MNILKNEFFCHKEKEIKPKINFNKIAIPCKIAIESCLTLRSTIITKHIGKSITDFPVFFYLKHAAFMSEGRLALHEQIKTCSSHLGTVVKFTRRDPISL